MGAWFFRHAFGEGGDGEKLAAPPARFLSPATTDAQRRRVLERFKQLTIACTWEEPESSFRLSFARNMTSPLLTPSLSIMSSMMTATGGICARPVRVWSP